MNAIKFTSLSVLLLFMSTLSVSCAEDDSFDFPKKEIIDDLVGSNYHDKDTTSNEGNCENEDEVFFGDDFSFSLYSDNSCGNQSAASYQNYLFLIPKYRGRIYMYNLKEKKLLCSYGMEAMKELNSSGGDIYHCNQSTFGVDFYDSSDPFPLLYISQRARSDKRCFTEVFRIIAKRSAQDNEFSSLKLELVQIIYYPPMSESNSLGNVNTVIDREKGLLYTYSRNNTKGDANYRQCKITCFAIPDAHKEEIILDDKDIIDSYMIDVSAYFMQGACIQGKYLYIARGASGVRYIDINIIDLEKKTLKTQLDLLDKGYRWEPEGCFYFDGHLMIATGKNIWELDFEDK